MGIFLKKYANYSDYQSAGNDDYVREVVPGVALVKDRYDLGTEPSVFYNEIEDDDKYREMPLTVECVSGGTFRFIQPVSILWHADEGGEGEGEESRTYYYVNATLPIYYRVNEGEWILLENTIPLGGEYDLEEDVYSAYKMELELTPGDTVQFKGKNTSYEDFKIFGNLYYDESEGPRFEVKGNIMSILDPNEAFPNNTNLTRYCFNRLFANIPNLVSAKHLILPAITLADYCYSNMFEYSRGLITAPSLPATTLANHCYDSMFNGCSRLTAAPAILPAATLAVNCYSYMFYYCTSLTTAPELPATTLTGACYANMFNGCTNLNYIKAMFTTEPSTNTYNWVNGVAATGTFVKNSAATWNVTGNNGVPTGWTVEIA